MNSHEGKTNVSGVFSPLHALGAEMGTFYISCGVCRLLALFLGRGVG